MDRCSEAQGVLSAPDPVLKGSQMFIQGPTKCSHNVPTGQVACVRPCVSLARGPGVKPGVISRVDWSYSIMCSNFPDKCFSEGAKGFTGPWDPMECPE